MNVYGVVKNVGLGKNGGERIVRALQFRIGTGEAVFAINGNALLGSGYRAEIAGFSNTSC